MSNTQTPTLAELRELRENVAVTYAAYMVEMKCANRKQYDVMTVENRSYGDLATIDALIAAQTETEGEKRG